MKFEKQVAMPHRYFIHSEKAMTKLVLPMSLLDATVPFLVPKIGSNTVYMGYIVYTSI